MLARQLTVAVCTGLVGLSACAHGEKSREHTSLTAVTNDELDKHADEREPHRMHYTTVSEDEALGSTRAQRAEARDEARRERAEEKTTGTVPAPTTSGTNADAEACELAVYFASDSVQLDVTSQQRLDRVAECMKRHEIDHATIVGSADPRGTEEHNKKLGQERAQVVAQYLHARGVPRKEIRVRSKGEMAAGDSRDAWPTNRSAGVDVKP